MKYRSLFLLFIISQTCLAAPSPKTSDYEYDFEKVIAELKDTCSDPKCKSEADKLLLKVQSYYLESQKAKTLTAQLAGYEAHGTADEFRKLKNEIKTKVDPKKFQDLSQELTQSKNDLKKNATQLASKVKEIDELNAQIAGQKVDIKTSNDKIRELNDEITALLERNSKLSKKNEQLQELNRLFEFEKDKLTAQMNTISKQLKNEASLSDKLRGEIKKANAQIGTSNTQIVNLQNAIKNQESNYVKKLTAQVEENKTLNNNIHDISQKLVERRQELANLNEEYEKLKKDAKNRLEAHRNTVLVISFVLIGLLLVGGVLTYYFKSARVGKKQADYDFVHKHKGFCKEWWDMFVFYDKARTVSVYLVIAGVFIFILLLFIYPLVIAKEATMSAILDDITTNPKLTIQILTAFAAPLTFSTALYVVIETNRYKLLSLVSGDLPETDSKESPAIDDK